MSVILLTETVNHYIAHIFLSSKLTCCKLCTNRHNHFQPPLPSQMMNGHRPPLPPTNGDMNNNMSASGQQSTNPNQGFPGSGHLKNGPMSLGAPS